MKKLLLMITLFSFVFWFTGCEKETLKSQDDIEILKKGAKRGNLIPNTFNECTEMEIWAGVGNKDAGTLIGHVTFEANKLTIDLDDGWKAKDVHIQFGEDFSDFPTTKKGNPKVGHFEYNLHYPIPSDFIEIEDIDLLEFGAIHIAAVQTACEYGKVDTEALEAIFEWYKENDVLINVIHNPNDPREGYFTLNILEEGGPLEGAYDNVFCIAPHVLITPGNNKYLTKIFNSYDESLFSYFDDLGFDYGNADLTVNKTNWFINNYHVGDMIQPIDSDGNSVGVEALVEWSHYQYAIWLLTSGFDGVYDNVKPYDELILNALIAEVDANIVEADAFIPGCGEDIIFVFVPLNGDVLQQPLITWFPVPCICGEETAWGDGKAGATFGKQWGTWFNYSDEECN
ncbi:MAG: hypothetical protein KAG37_03840 [Flavobacteriales bacterium]|nr:hypothetical protein [Flavobacteriales bacterium]